MSLTLELTVLSCENLLIDQKPIKKNAYVLVGFPDSNLKSHATNVNVTGGSWPRWNRKFIINMPMHQQHIILEVRRKSSSRSDKVIGISRMPVSDFIGGYLPVNYMNFLSYRLRDMNGERNGIVNVSVKVVDDGKESSISMGTMKTVADRNTRYNTSSGSEIAADGSVSWNQNVIIGFPGSLYAANK